LLIQIHVEENILLSCARRHTKATVVADSRAIGQMRVRRLPLVKAHVMPTAKLMATVKRPSRIRLTGCLSW
jgi:hypothetical protein